MEMKMSDERELKLQLLRLADGDVDRAESMLEWMTKPPAFAVAAFELWAVLDDIDTYSDVAKGDDKTYRSLVEKAQRRRFDILSGEAWDELRAQFVDTSKDDGLTRNHEPPAALTPAPQPDSEPGSGHGEVSDALAEFMQRPGAVKWEGGEMPFPAGTRADILLSDGQIIENSSSEIWSRVPLGCDYWAGPKTSTHIIAYEVKSYMNKHDRSPENPVSERAWIHHMSESGYSGGNGWSDEIDWTIVDLWEVRPEGPPDLLRILPAPEAKGTEGEGEPEIPEGWNRWEGASAERTNPDVSPSTMVEVLRRNGNRETDLAGSHEWELADDLKRIVPEFEELHDPDDDIIAYRVIEPTAEAPSTDATPAGEGETDPPLHERFPAGKAGRDYESGLVDGATYLGERKEDRSPAYLDGLIAGREVRDEFAPPPLSEEDPLAAALIQLEAEPTPEPDLEREAAGYAPVVRPEPAQITDNPTADEFMRGMRAEKHQSDKPGWLGSILGGKHKTVGA
jgi:hypothetical protein